MREYRSVLANAEVRLLQPTDMMQPWVSLYTKVSRYTTSAFMRIKLGQFENRGDAQAFHGKTITQENVA
jgi:hypothetical protein